MTDELDEILPHSSFCDDWHEPADPKDPYNCIDCNGEQKLKKAIQTLIDQAYRKGYNDNSRDCLCDSVDYRGFTERVPHRHLMDDGESYDIKPDITALQEENK